MKRYTWGVRLHAKKQKCPIMSQTLYKLNPKTLKMMITIKGITYGIKQKTRNRLVKIFASKNLKSVHPRAEVIKIVISKK